MYKHKARMTPRRYKILQLMAQGYTDDEIAKMLDLSKTNYNLQRWRLYCYIGEVHKPMDAVYVALQVGLLHDWDLSEKIRKEINMEEKSDFIDKKLALLPADTVRIALKITDKELTSYVSQGVINPEIIKDKPYYSLNDLEKLRQII